MQMNTQSQAPKKILIIGGGFAGIAAARSLVQEKIPNVSIQLVSKRNHFEYYPGLYRVVTGASPIEVCIPLTDMIPDSVTIDIDTITKLSLTENTIIGESGTIYHYDTLVIALGSETTFFNVPGLEALSLGFKSVNEALHLKQHLQSLFANHTNPAQDELVSHYHVVIVGGGPSGVEVAGDLSAYLQTLAKTYKVDPSLVTIDLIESNPRLVPTLPPQASAKILARLRKLGVNIFLNRQLMKNEIEEVYLKDMSMKAKTVIWTAGTQVSKILQEAQGLVWSPKKRIEVDEYLRAKGYDNVYIIGDAAATPFSGLAQTAMYDGDYVGSTIARFMKGKRAHVYKPKPIAFSIPVGVGWGVFVMGKFRLYGLIPYIIRHVIDFMYFAGTVSVYKLFSMFFDGWKYRNKTN